ncbi:MAG: ribonuclease III domain-containing protein [Candidatus Omnitrophica bacterium]|nr:ribonuclease III domain-containing protein [Candidatus Omnitrophota bacterium]
MQYINTLAALQEALNYHFRDEALLAEALTHPSYAYESREASVKDYNRLEFLGDSILGMVIAEYLYGKDNALSEGELTRLRSLIVNRENLCKKAEAMGLSSYMLLGKGEEKIGGRRNSTNLSACLEAVVAAVYLDGGLEEARKLILRAVV